MPERPEIHEVINEGVTRLDVIFERDFLRTDEPLKDAKLWGEVRLQL